MRGSGVSGRMVIAMMAGFITSSLDYVTVRRQERAGLPRTSPRCAAARARKRRSGSKYKRRRRRR